MKRFKYLAASLLPVAEDTDAQYRRSVGGCGGLRVLLSHGEPPWRMRHVEERRRRGPA